METQYDTQRTQNTHRRNVVDVVRGLFFAAHPIPAAFFMTAVALFSLRAMWPHVRWSVFLLLVLGHGAMQYSINLMNDYCDRFQDAITQPTKPIVRGLVRPREVFIASIVMSVLMVLLLLPLPPLALIISLAYLALGMAYNFGLKATAFSGLMLALVFALIPLYIFAGIGKLIPFAYWLVPVGFLLGAALNLANSLPDVEGDKKNGTRTLAVLLGLRGSFLVCYAFMLLSIALIGTLTITGLVASRAIITYPLLALSVLALIVMNVLFGPNKPAGTRRAYFIIISALSLIIAFGWCLSAIT